MNVRLSKLLPPEEVAALLQSSDIIQSYSPDLQESIRQAYGDGYNIMIKVLVGIAAGQLPASAVKWK
jgi:hypothetical protein